MTAGFAVDALEPEEAHRAERHLTECEDCRRDLVEFRETAARLARAEAVEPREQVWRALRAEAERTRQEPPRRTRPARASSRVRNLARWAPWGLAAALALFCTLLAGTLVSANERLAAQEARTAEMEALLAAADTNMLEAPLGDARATLFASYDRDAAVLVVEGLPQAPEGMNYRMWWFSGGEVRPAGVLEASGGGHHAGLAGGMGSPDQLWVSLEPEGDMAEPSGEELTIDM
ncbi:anti-sigma factor [Nocardiopsis sp. CC223A]|uniref:anti-sigma factor n=1 Tax=Nocardiopsis sp. CC223A TaxID=3044051 RepID=UPI0027954646|nr:anti-sigma factor [Nocardiopsis sp. CC223A]